MRTGASGSSSLSSMITVVLVEPHAAGSLDIDPSKASAGVPAFEVKHTIK